MCPGLATSSERQEQTFHTVRTSSRLTAGGGVIYLYPHVGSGHLTVRWWRHGLTAHQVHFTAVLSRCTTGRWRQSALEAICSGGGRGVEGQGAPGCGQLSLCGSPFLVRHDDDDVWFTESPNVKLQIAWFLMTCHQQLVSFKSTASAPI